MSEYFKYKGYHFKPVKQIDMTFEQITKRIVSTDIGLSVYDDGKGWDYDAFYKASGSSTMDVFFCEETGKYYLPGENELFIFREKGNYVT